MFRKLRADEIDVRVSTVNAKGVSLLLYKDARCDMNILDETVGAMNWQRRPELVGSNLHCHVSIWDKDKGQWVSKSDVGVESYTEKQKGEASDSFKRACFNWGIGRELYTAPFIWVKAGDVNIIEKNSKHTTYDKFMVEKIAYEGDKINGLSIVNEHGKKVFEQKSKTDFIDGLEKEQKQKEWDEIDKKIKAMLKEQKISVMQFYDAYKKNYGKVYLTSTIEDIKKCLDDMEKKKNVQ